MKLSICIPTFNRRKQLRTLLASVVTDRTDIEVCISDNASIDGTEEMVAEFRRHSVYRIVYVRSETNRGPDANFLNCVRIASGEYCWLMGSDDAIVPGAIDYVASVLDKWRPAVVLGARINCDEGLKPQTYLRFWKPKGTYGCEFADDTALSVQLMETTRIAGMFAYLSSNIVQRSLWVESEATLKFIGCSYIHVQQILQALDAPNRICVFTEVPIAYCRTGNDSFGEAGPARRHLIDLNGYGPLIDHYFAVRAKVRREALRVLRLEAGAGRRSRLILYLLFLRRRAPEHQWAQVTRVRERLFGYEFERSFAIILERILRCIYPTRK